MSEKPVKPEPIIDADLPIVDAHHHVRDRPGDRYLFEDLATDLARGHNVVSTVAIECGAMHRADGPVDYRSLGETAFLANVATMFDSGGQDAPNGCAAIVGYADLLLGSDIQPLLDAHIAASGKRLRGIRNPVAWHPSQQLRTKRFGSAGQLRNSRFRRGVRALAAKGLVLDMWIYHTQLGDMADLARACPETTIVLDHLGGPICTGPYAGKQDQVFADWRTCLPAVAACPNVQCKLGGLGQPIVGQGFDLRADRPTSAELAAAWHPYIDTAIDLFGVDRCMFESNFPPDKASCSYVVLWNTFKRITAGYTEADRTALFSGTATRVYGLEESLPAAE